MRLLVEQTPEIARSLEGKGHLDSVWEHLGFSIQQKLAISVEYSGRLEGLLS
jgi:hypothetical protein